MAFDFSMYGRQIQQDQAAKELALKQQLGAQQLQQGAVDTQSKKTLYAVQLLSGAQDPATWQRTKTMLGGMGVDTSMFSDDFNTGRQQVEGVRQAFYNANPLNQLLGLGLKGEATLNSGAQTFGNANTAAQQDPLSAATATAAANAIKGGAPSIGIPPSSANPPVARITPPASYNPLPTPPRAQNIQSSGSVGGMPLSGQANTQLAGAVGGISGDEASYQPPSQQPGETYDAYTKRVEMDPRYQAQVEQMKARAQKVGAGQGDTTVDATKAKVSYDQAAQVIEGLKSLISQGDVPTGLGFIPPAAKAAIANGMGNSKVSDAHNAFKMLNEAQTISTIRALADTGQIKMTRTLENIINRGYLVDESATTQSKLEQANIVETELKNSWIAAHNASADLNGGSQIPMEAMPLQSVGPPGGKLIGTSGGKKVFQMPDGSHVMEQ